MSKIRNDWRPVQLFAGHEKSKTNIQPIPNQNLFFSNDLNVDWTGHGFVKQEAVS